MWNKQLENVAEACWQPLTLEKQSTVKDTDHEYDCPGFYGFNKTLQDTSSVRTIH